MEAHAAIDNKDILNAVLDRYSTAAATWNTVITTHAGRLFWTLAMISMVWTFGMMAMRKADLGEFYAEFVRFTIFTGLFWWLLTNGAAMATSIMDSLRQVGAEAAGVPNNLAPSGIVDIGFDIFFKVLDTASLWQPLDSATGLVISGIVLVVFALVGVNMLLLLVSGWVLAYAGVFFLGFGGARWTSDMAIAYYKMILNIAAQLFAMVLLVGVGKSFVDLYYSGMSAGLTLKELAVMLIVAIILLSLVRTIPPMVGSLSGASTPSLAGAFGAGAVVGAAAFASAGMATAGAALATGGVGVMGGAQALMAAFSRANESHDTGTASVAQRAMPATDKGGPSSFASAMGTGHVGSVDAGGQSQAFPKFGSVATETAGSNTAQAGAPRRSAVGATGAGHSDGAPGEVKRSNALKGMGSAAVKVGKVALGTAGHLAIGAWDVARETAGDAKANMGERIGDSTGGKVAAAIKVRGRSSELGASEDGSLSCADTPADREAEVIAFQNRSSARFGRHSPETSA